MSKYGLFSGPYFPVFSPNTGKYRPEKTPYLDTFHAVSGRLSPETDMTDSKNKDASINISILLHEIKTSQVKTFLMFLSCSYFWGNFRLNVLIKLFL